MRTNSEAIAAGCVAAAVLSAGVWHYGTRAPLAHGLVGIDPSLSVEPNCAGVCGMTRGLLLNRPGMREGSTLTLLAMGATRLNPEPELRFTSRVPIAGDRVYGQEEQKRQYQLELMELLDGLEGACSGIEATRHTPLYRLVEQGLAHLRSEGMNCPPGGRCFFLIKTDLLEDVHPALTALLRKAAKDPAVPVPADLAQSLDNTGVEVSFCGTGEVRLTKAPAPPSLDARTRIWGELFTHPELVSVRPFCIATPVAATL